MPLVGQTLQVPLFKVGIFKDEEGNTVGLSQFEALPQGSNEEASWSGQPCL